MVSENSRLFYTSRWVAVVTKTMFCDVTVTFDPWILIISSFNPIGRLRQNLKKVCDLFSGNPVKSRWDLSLKGATGGSPNSVHPLATIKVSNNFHGNPFILCSAVLFWLNVVTDQLTGKNRASGQNILESSCKISTKWISP